MIPTTILVHAVSGLLGNRIMAWFQEWTWLSDKEKSKLSGPLADWVSWVLAAGSGYLSGWLGMANGLLESGDLWPYALGAVVSSKLWFEGQKAIRNFKK